MHVAGWQNIQAKTGTLEMKIAAYVGALALTTIILLPTCAATYATEAGTPAELSQVSSAINIGRIKSVLQLTPEQERHWPPIEAALRTLARQQMRSEPSGFMRRISRGVVSVVLNGAAVERLAVAARPLIAMLTQEQMRSASGLAQEMGLGPVVMAALR